jgi:hypothetical protein
MNKANPPKGMTNHSPHRAWHFHQTSGCVHPENATQINYNAYTLGITSPVYELIYKRRPTFSIASQREGFSLKYCTALSLPCPNLQIHSDDRLILCVFSTLNASSRNIPSLLDDADKCTLLTLRMEQTVNLIKCHEIMMSQNLWKNHDQAFAWCWQMQSLTLRMEQTVNLIKCHKKSWSHRIYGKTMIKQAFAWCWRMHSLTLRMEQTVNLLKRHTKSWSCSIYGKTICFSNLKFPFWSEAQAHSRANGSKEL